MNETEISSPPIARKKHTETALHGVSNNLRHTLPGYSIQVLQLDEQE